LTVWLPALAGRLWLTLNALTFRASLVAFRLKPEATPTNQHRHPNHLPVRDSGTIRTLTIRVPS
jgi:hypothetical protein